MKLIANADCKWGIGRNGGMLFDIPEDLRFFRDHTTGGVVIMGRATLESLPGGRPLKNRLNIVLTKSGKLADVNNTADNLIVCGSIDEAVEAASGADPDCVYVIGGAMVYRQMLDLCDEALVTRVDADGEADCFMPDLEADPAWSFVETLGEGERDGLKYEFCRYARSAKPN